MNKARILTQNAAAAEHRAPASRGFRRPQKIGYNAEMDKPKNDREFAESAAAARGFFVSRLKNKRLVVGNAEGARPLN